VRRSLELQLWRQMTRPKYVGWAGLAAIYGLLAGSQFKSAVGAAAVDIWFALTQAPTVCGASARTGRCGNNGKGLLRGCHFQRHNEQRLSSLRHRDWIELRSHVARNSITVALFALSAAALIVGLGGWLVQSL
jgi:hypothetical protein